jgi:NitT/TauT family transport system substrate-binding protein
MAQRLTTFSKLLITLLIVGGVFFGFTYLKNKGMFGPKSNGDDPNSSESKKSDYKDDDVIKVGVVTWGGYAGGEYFNEGFAASQASRFYKDYGILVDFKLLDDFDASRDAFKADEVNLLWTTIDAFPTEAPGLAQYEPRVVFQSDWSRGGDAIVVQRGIRNVADLKGKKIAVAPMTPSHTFLIWLLDAGGLSPKDVKLTEVPSAIDAADAFKSGQVDAAVVWSPDDADCVSKVPGSKILQNTKNASNIIADVFIAKKAYIDANQDKLAKLYEGWMRGAAEINASDANKRKAARILAEGLQQPEDFCYDAINNVRLVTHGDNLDFFGLNPDYNGVTGEDLYNKMKVTYNNLGYSTEGAPSWRIIADKGTVGSRSLDFAGSDQAAEGKKQFTKITNAESENKEAIATKQVSISFRSGEFQLDENAKYIIDKEFADIAKMFSNSRIRIEGNTDNVGSLQNNIALSKKRAQSVADYLASQYKFPSERFVIIGNGPNNPVQGCADNASEDCKSRNRRTDFELIAD